MDVSVIGWMSSDPIAIGVESSAHEALERMLERGIRHLPVIDARRRVVGVLSVDDLAAALPFAVSHRRPLSPRERQLAREWSISEVMTHAPETLPASGTLSQAAERMAARRIGCLPIVDDAGALIGILTETDLLHALAFSLREERVPEDRPPEDALDALVSELRRERAQLARRLDRYHRDERDLSADAHDQPMDDPERSADLRVVDLTERLDERAVRRLEAIDRALDHAAQGRLSVCDRCGGHIPLVRLRALPGTTICVVCARAQEFGEPGRETEEPFERVPGGRAETGRVELGSSVYTRFGEGRLLRIAPFGTCPRCGVVEGYREADSDTVRCGMDGCRQSLPDVMERAIVAIGERDVYVEPAELSPIHVAPFD